MASFVHSGDIIRDADIVLELRWNSVSIAIEFPDHAAAKQAFVQMAAVVQRGDALVIDRNSIQGQG